MDDLIGIGENPTETSVEINKGENGKIVLNLTNEYPDAAANDEDYDSDSYQNLNDDNQVDLNTEDEETPQRSNSLQSNNSIFSARHISVSEKSHSVNSHDSLAGTIERMKNDIFEPTEHQLEV